MTRRYFPSRLKVPMRFTVAKNKGGITSSYPPFHLSYPFDRVAGAKCVEGKFSRYRENSLSLFPPFHPEGETEAATWRGAMKNDDAALVKEMKSGLVPRKREREEGRGLENRTIDRGSVLLTFEERRTKRNKA